MIKKIGAVKKGEWMQEFSLRTAHKVDEIIDYLEASKGECNQCFVQCRECVECRKNLNPPEHEEDWTIKLHMLSHQINAGEKKWVDLENYIRDNFISKKKIIYEIEECSNYHDPEQVLKNELLESLGLGD